ncbi:splicing factor 1 isoform X1 [Lingula anatina]|uniref:Branchpoint-bridging protein n=2 Tax=Lingula anatina TaxID=7574 RepID=A0A1S3KCY7_LINAN|nr:splicing factor 1 isoform X1 [Lingula anatina]|eukprot:XP_013420116.2 splicing factor 1 isoform X1 [Lingula anatina]
MAKREADFGQSTNWPPDKKKKRRSRWGGDDAEKTFIPGMPTVIPTGLTMEQEKQYLVHLQIEEISRRLRTGDLGIPTNPEERSPSPEPIYNSEGKRLNTREYRTRKKLEEERHALIQDAMNLNDEYKPPADYKPPIIRVSDKVMIPQEEHPDINFVGLLIGPRGNTLKNLEKDTGAKIIIRGKGSVKEGKIGRKDGQPLPGEDEPLHAYVTANNPENVAKAVEKIKEIIKQGIEVPEGQNDLRRQQLRELALLNGTLRENDGLAKLKQLQQAQTIVTNTIICTVCGGAGHLGQDCKQKKPGDSFRNLTAMAPTPIDKAKMDSEYMSLMAELGEGPPPEQPKPQPPQHPQFNTNPPRMPFGGPPSHQPQNDFAPRRSRFNEPPGVAPGGPPPHSTAGSSLLNPPWLQQAQQQQQMLQEQERMRQQSQQPPHSQQQPPSLMNIPAQPTGTLSGQTPLGMPPPSTAGSMPPWQQQQQSTTAGGSTPLLSAPPPPPPSMTSWQNNTNTSGVPPPPPGSMGSSMPPWQSGPPPPPVPPVQYPWQQAPPPPAPVAPPPPPPSSQAGFNPMAPPPPPPSAGNNYGGLQGLNPLLGAPPPPPPS